jgi:hypothetical protein
MISTSPKVKGKRKRKWENIKRKRKIIRFRFTLIRFPFTFIRFPFTFYSETLIGGKVWLPLSSSVRLLSFPSVPLSFKKLPSRSHHGPPAHHGILPYPPNVHMATKRAGCTPNAQSISLRTWTKSGRDDRAKMPPLTKLHSKTWKKKQIQPLVHSFSSINQFCSLISLARK